MIPCDFIRFSGPGDVWDETIPVEIADKVRGRLVKTWVPAPGHRPETADLLLQTPSVWEPDGALRNLLGIAGDCEWDTLEAAMSGVVSMAHCLGDRADGIDVAVRNLQQARRWLIATADAALPEADADGGKEMP